MIGDFSSFAGGWRVLFRDYSPVAGRRKYDRQYSGLIEEQRNATGIVPGSRHLVLERCRDEIGDWRIILHSPYGRRVHEPRRWRLPGEYMRYGALTRRWSPVMTAVLHVFLTPMVNCPMPRFFMFEPEKLLQIVREAVGSSALFRRPFSRMRRAGIINAGAHSAIAPRFGNNGCAPVSCWKSLRDIRIFRSFSKPYANVCKMFMIFPHWNV
ncbi:hypothetical protein ACP0HM_06835 [Escherichia coli]